MFLSKKARGNVIRSLLEREFGGLTKGEALEKALSLAEGKEEEVTRPSPTRDEDEPKGGGGLSSFTI